MPQSNANVLECATPTTPIPDAIHTFGGPSALNVQVDSNRTNPSFLAMVAIWKAGVDHIPDSTLAPTSIPENAAEPTAPRRSGPGSGLSSR